MEPSLIPTWVRNLITTFSSSLAPFFFFYLRGLSTLRLAIALRLNINPILLRDTSLARRSFSSHDAPGQLSGLLCVRPWRGGTSIGTRTGRVLGARFRRWAFGIA